MESPPYRWVHIDPGVTLRDWFAGLAMQGKIANGHTVGNAEYVAERAYAYADAMLARRETIDNEIQNDR